MSRTTVSTIALSMSAACLATLIAACGTEDSQAEPLTKADEVAESARSYVDGDHGEIDPAQRRYLAVYFSDRAMSDVWQRHPELIGRAQRSYLALYYSDRAMSDVWQRHPELIGRAR